jgi:hypothetical protein
MGERCHYLCLTKVRVPFENSLVPSACVSQKQRLVVRYHRGSLLYDYLLKSDQRDLLSLTTAKVAGQQESLIDMDDSFVC